MKVIIEFNIDNAAFHDETGHLYRDEVARVIRESADKFFIEEETVKDVNGNTIGSIRTERETS